MIELLRYMRNILFRQLLVQSNILELMLGVRGVNSIEMWGFTLVQVVPKYRTACVKSFYRKLTVRFLYDS